MAHVSLRTVAKYIVTKFPKLTVRQVDDLLIIRELNSRRSSDASKRDTVDRPKGAATAVSSAQAKTRTGFQEAGRYAKEALRDPLKRKLFESVAERRNTSPYAVAVGNRMSGPKITDARFREDNRSNRAIDIYARDNVQVATVEVIVRDKSRGKLQARGFAEPSTTRKTWTFELPKNLPPTSNLTAEVIARNHCERSATETIEG